MRGAVVVLVVLMVSATVAIAQPGNTPPGGGPTYGPAPPTTTPPPVTGPIPGEKSPGIALSLSLGGTVGSYVLAVAGGETESDGLSTVGAIGVFLAPSFGHWYAGKGWTDGLTLRLAGIGAVMVGAILLIGDCGFEGSCSDDEEAPAAIIMVVGAGAYVGGTILDIATAPGQARTYNERLRERAANGWALAPVVTGDRAGLVLSGRF